MSRLQQLHSRGRRSPVLRALALLLASPALVAGCGEVTCPEGTTNVDGVCRRGGGSVVDEPMGPEVELPGDSGVPLPDELCDGVDNDGDQSIDEDWPELGQPCGEGGDRGECVSGQYVCAKGGDGVVCEGAVGPAEELCDGKDNDCDGQIDEEVLSVKQERFDDHATVVGIGGGFVVSRLVVGMLRIETYGFDGIRTGYHDDLANPGTNTAFLESSAASGRVLVALGRNQFHVVEAEVDADLVPVIVRQQELHDDWDQGIDWGIYEPPYHPRVSANPPRFVGHRDLITFALSPFSADTLSGLQSAPVEAKGLPYLAYFDAAGAFAVWEQNENVRAGWLLDDGELLLDIDIGRGNRPAIALGEDGPGIIYLDGEQLLITELGGLTLQCSEGRFCNEEIAAAPIEATSQTAMGLAHDASTDSWVVAAGEELLVVGRSEEGPVIKQSIVSSVGDELPRRIDVAVSGGTAAIAQTAENDDTVLTFMGCF